MRAPGFTLGDGPGAGLGLGDGPGAGLGLGDGPGAGRGPGRGFGVGPTLPRRIAAPPTPLPPAPGRRTAVNAYLRATPVDPAVASSAAAGTRDAASLVSTSRAPTL
ncbi:hypothetical protein FJV46_06485 [Arthrobacter agilis]|nr:hypothetical protein B8W74_08590 [Arthrobacter agilis]PPB45510.1 hypothetical protein CI784_10580 [Arthrobacter agilis]TPV26513.1 hypothetical protein FJV46_06485 [Arthrobacter agilis]